LSRFNEFAFLSPVVFAFLLAELLVDVLLVAGLAFLELPDLFVVAGAGRDTDWRSVFLVLLVLLLLFRCALANSDEKNIKDDINNTKVKRCLNDIVFI